MPTPGHVPDDDTTEITLPAGYTQLEWIESTGEQAIVLDLPNSAHIYELQCTLFSKLSNLRYQTEQLSTLLGMSNGDLEMSGMFPTNIPSVYTLFMDVNNNSKFVDMTDFSLVYSSRLSSSQIFGKRMTVKKSYAETVIKFEDGSIDDIVINHSDADSFDNYSASMSLFAMNCSDSAIIGTFNHFSKMRVYRFKQYTDTTLWRDLIPAINSQGQIGLYDIERGTFFENQNSDATTDFIAGPAIISTPEPPTNLTASVSQSGAISLQWTASVSNVDGYKIYLVDGVRDSASDTVTDNSSSVIDGTLIATTSTPGYELQDSLPNTDYTFTVTAYIGELESSPVSIKVRYEMVPAISSVSLSPNPVDANASLDISVEVGEEMGDVTITNL